MGPQGEYFNRQYHSRSRLGTDGDDPRGEFGILRGLEQRAEVGPAPRDQDNE